MRKYNNNNNQKLENKNYILSLPYAKNMFSPFHSYKP